MEKSALLSDRPVYHVLFWAFYGALLVMLYSPDLPHLDQLLGYVGVLVAGQVIAVYVDNYVLIPRLLYEKKMGWHLLIYAGLLAGCVWLMYQAHSLLFSRDPRLWNLYFKRWDAAIVTPALMVIFSTTLFGFAKLWADKVRNDARTQQLENDKLTLAKEKLEVELKFLKAQINPHFLFNAINSIFNLITRDPDRARDALAQFSDMLRYHLYETTADRVPLAREIGYIRSYAALEQLRRGPALRVNVELDEGLGYALVLPLVLLTFVENAFKHLSSHADRPNWVSIRLWQEGDALHFTVQNSQQKRSVPPPVGGIGLVNIRRRLQLAYPGAHDLTIADQPGTYAVSLRVPLDAASTFH